MQILSFCGLSFFYVQNCNIKLLRKIASMDSGIIFMIIIIYFYHYYYHYYCCCYCYCSFIIIIIVIIIIVCLHKTSKEDNKIDQLHSTP